MTLEDADNAITHWVLCGCYGVLLLVFLYGLLRLLASRWRSRVGIVLLHGSHRDIARICFARCDVKM